VYVDASVGVCVVTYAVLAFGVYELVDVDVGRDVDVDVCVYVDV